MNSKSYRCCAVPQCTSTSIKTPNKLFVFMPYKKTIRDKWLKLARRDLTGILPKTQLYFCEDHFDLPNDMENYMQYHLMGSVSQIRMKPGSIPLKFACQHDRRKQTFDTTERQFVKKQRMMIIEECLKKKEVEEEENVDTKRLELGETSCGSSDKLQQVVQDTFSYNVNCYNCNAEITGHRYICLQCVDVNLCSSCEAAGYHPEHAVLRLPSAILYCVIEPCLDPLRVALKNKFSEASPNQIEITLEVIKTEPPDTPDETEPLCDTGPTTNTGPAEAAEHVADDRRLSLLTKYDEPFIIVREPKKEPDEDPLIKTEYEDNPEETVQDDDIFECSKKIDRLTTSIISKSESCRTVPHKPSRSKTQAQTHVKNVSKRKRTFDTARESTSTEDPRIQTSEQDSGAGIKKFIEYASHKKK